MMLENPAATELHEMPSPDAPAAPVGELPAKPIPEESIPAQPDPAGAVPELPPVDPAVAFEPALFTPTPTEPYKPKAAPSGVDIAVALEAAAAR
jgi:hypothetical protein